MNADDRLRRALGLGKQTPPPVDYGFVARTVERIEARRFLGRLAVLALWAGVAALLGWSLVPALEPLAPEAVTGWLAGLTLAGLGLWILLRGGGTQLMARVRRSFRFGRLQH